MMHILVIPSWYKKHGAPLLGSFFAEQVKMLQTRGLKVGVLYPDWSGSFMKNLSRKTVFDEYSDEGVPVLRLQLNSPVPRIRRINYNWIGKKTLALFQRYSDTFGKPDIIHSHSVFVGGVAASYICRRTGIPLVHTEHSSSMISGEGYMNKGDRQAIKEVIEASMKFFCVSTFQKDTLVHRYSHQNDNIEVLPNMVNSLFHRSFSPRKKSSPFKVIFIGRLASGKLPLLAARSVEIMNQRGISSELVMIGEGKLREDILNFCSRSQYGDCIKLEGQVEREKVKSLIDASHLLVSTSTLETFGINIIEALACGRPVVCTDSGGPRDIVNRRNGIILSDKEPEDVAEAIEQIVTNYDQYDQEAIRQECIERFSEESLFKKLYPYYEGVLND